MPNPPDTTTAPGPTWTTACNLRSGWALRTCVFGMLSVLLAGQSSQPGWAQSPAAIQAFINAGQRRM